MPERENDETRPRMPSRTTEPPGSMPVTGDAPDEPVADEALDQPLDVRETADDEPAPAAPRAHDAAWYTDIVRAHERELFRFLVRRTGAEAEDLVADVLTIAWRRREDVPDGAELPWLYRTAGFVLANHRRKGRPIPVERLPEEVDDDDPALRAVRDERVRAALAALSTRDRQIVLLNAWEGLQGEALAEVLGISRGGADAALSRARSRLAAAWAGDEED
jgi:RNA polymerase sigma factor (sigma-70 family)